MKRIILILIFLNLLSLTANAQNDPTDMTFRGEYSNNSFNTEGKLTNNYFSKNGKEFISNYDGNLILEYSISTPPDREIPIKKTLTYNANVHHSIFNYNTESVEEDYIEGFDITSPEWITGINGFAISVNHPEQRMNMLYSNGMAAYNTSNSGALIGEQTPILIPGYHFTAKIKNSLDEYSTILAQHDFIRLLRSDGTLLTLVNVEHSDNTGYYVQIAPGFDDIGYVKFENGSRVLYYKPGDGLTYKFVENEVPFKIIRADNGGEINVNLRKMTFSKILSPTGIEVDITTDMNFYGQIIETESENSFIGTGYNEYLPQSRSTNRTHSRSRMISKVIIKDDKGSIVVDDSITYTVDYREYKFDILMADARYLHCEIPSYLVESIISGDGKKTEYDFYEKDGFSQNSPEFIDLSESWAGDTFSQEATYRDCMSRFIIKDVKRYVQKADMSWEVKISKQFDYSFIPNQSCPGSFNFLAFVPNISTQITTTSWNSTYSISTIDNYYFNAYKVYFGNRFALSPSGASGLKEHKIIKLIKHNKYENSNLVLEEEFDFGIPNTGYLSTRGYCSTTALNIHEHNGTSYQPSLLLSLYPLTKTFTDNDKELIEITDYIYSEEQISTGTNSEIRVIDKQEKYYQNGLIKEINYDTDFYDPDYDNTQQAYNTSLAKSMKISEFGGTVKSIIEFDYYISTPQGSGKLKERRNFDPTDISRFSKTNYEYVTTSDYNTTSGVGLYVGKVKKITADNGLNIELYYPAQGNGPEILNDVKFVTKAGNILTVEELAVTDFYEEVDKEPYLVPRVVNTYFGTELRFSNQQAFEWADVGFNNKGYLIVDENNFIKMVISDAFNRMISSFLPGTFEEFNPSYQNIDWDLPEDIVYPVTFSTNSNYNYYNRTIQSKSVFDPSITNPNEICLQDSFDIFGNIISKERNDIIISESEYDILGMNRKTTNGVGVTEDYLYFLNGEIKKNTHPDYSHNENSYDNSTLTFDGVSAIRAKETIDEINNKIYTFFDARGNIIATNHTYSTTNATIYKYNNINQLVEVISPENKSTNYSYDGFGNIKSKTSPDGGTYKYKFDKWGNLRFTYHTTANEGIIFNSYDPLNRLITTGIYPGNQSTFDYLDPDVTQSFDSNENYLVSKNMYDNYTITGAFNSLAPKSPTEIDDMNIKARLSATAYRDEESSSSNWNLKYYEYDHLGNIRQLNEKIYGEDWKFIKNEYDHIGNLVFQNINNEHFIWNGYDLQNRLILVKSNSSNNETTSVIEAEYDYNNADQIVRIGTDGYENILEDLTISNTQNHEAPLVVANNVTVTSSGILTVKGGAGITLNSGFNVALGGELHTIIDPAIGEGSAFGATNYCYNERGWVENINNNSGAVYERFKEYLNYELNGNIEEQTITNKGNNGWDVLEFNYIYDNMNRLTNANCNESDFTESFSYDSDGNFSTKYRTGKSLSFQYLGSTNKVSTITGTKNYTYSHDTKGNITLKKNTGGTDIYTATEYDHRNLPLTVNTSTNYKYDDSGNRVVKNTGTKNQHYLLDHTGREVAIYNLSTNAIEQVNIFGNGMVGYVEKGSTDKRYYYVKDHLGSIRLVIDEDGDISSARDYYAYGDILREYVVGNEEKYKFTEKERDSETGLDYFGARYFDSEVGRWTSVDPLADKYPGWSPYNYTANNPLNYIDPNGMDWYSTTDSNGTTSYHWNADLTADNASDILTDGQSYVGAGFINVDNSNPFFSSSVIGDQYGNVTTTLTGRTSLDGLQVVMEGFGTAPVIGDAVDGLNALLYLSKGDYENAGYAALAMVPIAGNIKLISKWRKRIGGDGALSRHLIEVVDGKTNSKIHQVFNNGGIIHQHQTHFGKYGSSRQFPESWLKYKNINK